MTSNRFLLTIAFLVSSSAVTCAKKPTCETQGCPTGFECRKETVLETAKFPRCLPSIRDILRGRLDEYERAWNNRDYQALENFYTGDSVFVPAGVDIRRGNDGYANFIEGLITDNNWGSAKWTIQDVIYVTDELVFTVDTFEWERLPSGNPLSGKDIILWKIIDGTYYIQYGVSNLPGA
ncbi:uncharacterized protein LOC135480096 [Liolophura sinensis]|uniref:uncharacterized protein LOC135480096 n=1 Tax=Liolophura sinensis TaxID=3198878 RepID=UPI003157FA31